MITKMKKLTFLVYHKEYEAFLAQIRELGVVHVVERQCGEMDDTLQQFMQKRTLYKNMLQSMHTLADKQPEEKVHKELSADALVKFYEDLQARIQDLNQQIPAIDKDGSRGRFRLESHPQAGRCWLVRAVLYLPGERL